MRHLCVALLVATCGCGKIPIIDNSPLQPDGHIGPRIECRSSGPYDVFYGDCCPEDGAKCACIRQTYIAQSGQTVATETCGVIN